MDDIFDLILILIIAIISAAGFGYIGFSIGSVEQIEAIRSQAIDVGAAEYYLDENHEKQFRWIEPTQE